MKKYTGPMRICHRGLIQAAPENTIGAFEAAYQLGFEGLEIDIQSSKDGEIVIFHDYDLTRMTIGDPKEFRIDKISSLTWDELSGVKLPFANHLLCKEIPLHSEIEDFLLDPLRVLGQADDCLYADMLQKDPRTASIMRFEELVDWIKEKDIQMTVEVEVKAGGLIPRLYSILDRSGIADRFIVFSGNKDYIREIQDTARKDGKPDGLRLGANIVCLENDDIRNKVKVMDLWEIGLNDFRFDESDVKWCADHGIRVFSNLGDYPRWWKRMNELGIAGFKTNYPEAYTVWWTEDYTES